MNPAAMESLRRRVRQARSRARVRRWEYRQRNRSKGTWNRLARILAGAREIYAIPEEAAERLRREGYVPEPAGVTIQPPKEIFSLPPERLQTLDERRPFPVRLGPEFLAAKHVVLVPFGLGVSPSRSPPEP